VAEYTVKLLEDCPLFNAGRGAVYAHNGEHELEASLMDGRNMRCGAVAMVKRTKNPISLARTIMEHTPHVFMVGSAAEKLGQRYGLHMVDHSYFHTERRYQQFLAAQSAKIVARDHDISTSGAAATSTTSSLSSSSTSSSASSASSAPAATATSAEISKPEQNGHSAPSLMNDGGNTVGCVVMFNGHLAAATSTGGLTNKLSGRLGDTPIIGAGTYAHDNSCAVSATGVGEEFLRRCVAHDVSALMRYAGMSLHDAVNKVVHEGLPPSTGGLIAVDAQGNISMEINCTGMFRAACDSDGHFCIGIYSDEEPLDLSAQLPELLTTLRERPPRLRTAPRLANRTKMIDHFSHHVPWREYVTVVPALSPRSEENENLLGRVFVFNEQADERKSPVRD
jgi:beta-aspartyl-peptidase (threonine type)